MSYFYAAHELLLFSPICGVFFKLVGWGFRDGLLHDAYDAKFIIISDLQWVAGIKKTYH